MSYLIKSRFVREEFLRYGLTLALFLWATTATVYAVSKQAKTVLIGVSDQATFVIGETNQSTSKKETLSFAKEFLLSYYQYSPESFGTNISRAGDLMNEALWERLLPELSKLGARLKSEPLTQTAKIISIDEIAQGKFEATLELQVLRKLDTSKAKVRVSLRISKKPRTEQNPWPFEIDEVQDAVL